MWVSDRRWVSSEPSGAAQTTTIWWASEEYHLQTLDITIGHSNDSRNARPKAGSLPIAEFAASFDIFAFCS